MADWEANVRRVVPYTPGEQPKRNDIIKLNTNECPYPPAPGVTKALQEFEADKLRLYPDPALLELREAIAAAVSIPEHPVAADQVFVGVGSDDVLALAFLTFLTAKTDSVPGHHLFLLRRLGGFVRNSLSDAWAG